jgi:alpha-L-rhamnosidase
MAPTGHFACSNPLLNQLQHNIVWGQKSNFLEIPTDCPQRDERLGWTGDAHVFIRTAAFNMDVRRFFDKWLRDVRDAQGPNGEVPTTVPAAVLPQWPDGGPAWSDAIIICAWETYLAFGDRSVLEPHYDAMNFFMKFIAEHRCLNHIRSHPAVDKWGGFGDWLALDGSGRNEGNTPHDLIGTAFYAHDAGIMAQIAGVLGRGGDAARYTDLRDKIVEAFQKRFVSPDGTLLAATQTACVLALEFDLLTAEMRPGALRQLVRDIEGRQDHLATGFVGTPYLLDVLESGGRLDVAYRLLEQETFPSWLFPVKHGATTIWERWDGWTPEKGFQDAEMNSFNHYAYGAVGAWMYRTVAGLRIDSAEPGYRHVIFRPRPGGTLTWAEASLVTPQGKASIAWKLDEGVLKLDLVVPPGCRATLDLPEGYSAPSDVPVGSHHHVLKKSR